SYLAGTCRTWPWHGSGTRHLEFLRRQIRQGRREQAGGAWSCLLATRDDQVVEAAMKEAPSLHRRWAHPGGNYDRGLAAYTEEEGLAVEENEMRRLHGESAWHLVFPKGYLEEGSEPWRQRIHPTNRELSDLSGPMRFGGQGAGKCGFCKEKLHHILT